jgi:hypothetical protein
MTAETITWIAFGVFLFATAVALFRRAVADTSPLSRVGSVSSALVALAAAFYALRFQSFAEVPRAVLLFGAGLIALTLLFEIGEAIGRRRRGNVDD